MHESARDDLHSVRKAPTLLTSPWDQRNQKQHCLVRLLQVYKATKLFKVISIIEQNMGLQSYCSQALFSLNREF